MRSKNEEILKRIVEIINDSYYQGEASPSMKDIADSLDISLPTASRYINELISRGELEKDSRYGELRTPKIIRDSNTIKCPVVGEIACGTPLLAEENIEFYVNLSKELFGNGKYFILRANGNSMINAGIDNGDLVVVRQQETAEQGQIVVALIDNEATLKRYYLDRRRKKIRLHPENDNMEDMYYSSVAIQGVAVKVIKDLK
ncbi:MAG TPA: repressor LexA [Clostridiales bacterium]|nr:repressor LexA [Clostridiales bacterium]